MECGACIMYTNDILVVEYENGYYSSPSSFFEWGFFSVFNNVRLASGISRQRLVKRQHKRLFGVLKSH
jgi:hypothetical protein